MRVTRILTGGGIAIAGILVFLFGASVEGQETIVRYALVFGGIGLLSMGVVIAEIPENGFQFWRYGLALILVFFGFSVAIGPAVFDPDWSAAASYGIAVLGMASVAAGATLTTIRRKSLEHDGATLELNYRSAYVTFWLLFHFLLFGFIFGEMYDVAVDPRWVFGSLFFAVFVTYYILRAWFGPEENGTSDGSSTGSAGTGD